MKTTSFATFAALGLGLMIAVQGQTTQSASPPVLQLDATIQESSNNEVLLAQHETEDEPETQEKKKTKRPNSIKYGDGKADGKKSLGGSGHLIRFKLPSEERKVAGLRMHAARYGQPTPPDEEVEISFLSKDQSEVLDTHSVKYGKFKRGDSRWVTIKFKEPLELPEVFWVAVDFDPGRTKGVYLSYDTNSDGKNSRIGLPGAKSKPVEFNGDWMIQAILKK